MLSWMKNNSIFIIGTVIIGSLTYLLSSLHTTDTSKNMKSIAAITILASSAAAFAPTPVSRVESTLSYAKELDSMFGTTVETGGRVVRSYILINNGVLLPLLIPFISSLVRPSQPQ